MGASMDDSHRGAALEFGMLGCTGFARALNLTDDMARPWIVSPEIREQALYHLTQLVGLVETAELLPNPAHATYRAAKDDAGLRRLLRTLQDAT